MTPFGEAKLHDNRQHSSGGNKSLQMASRHPFTCFVHDFLWDAHLVVCQTDREQRAD